MLTCDSYFMNKTVNVSIYFGDTITYLEGIVKDTNQAGITIEITKSDSDRYKDKSVVFLPIGLQFTISAEAPEEKIHARIHPHLPPGLD